MAEPASELFKIGEVAKRTGFTRQQIHNFLTMGLIREDSRTDAGHRLFGREVFRRLSVIRGLLSQNYPLTEIRRTWQAFLRAVLICLALTLGGVAGGIVLAAEAASAPSKEDIAEIRKLFRRLEEMMCQGDSSMVGGLLAGSVNRQRQHQIVEALDSEFESRDYTAFDCTFDEKADIEPLGKDKVQIGVLIRYQYSEPSQGTVSQGDEDGQVFYFDLTKGKDGWRISHARFFTTLSSTQDTILGKIFMYAAIIFVVGSFWGWMLLDCCFRNWGGRKLPWVLAVVMVPGVGALAYFFVVWMRQGPED